MQRLLLIFSSLGLPLLVANFVGLTLGALLATLGIGLLTAVCLVPIVLLSELISRRGESPRANEKGRAL